MRIFALETDTEKLTSTLLSKGEEALMVIRFHGFLFYVRLLGYLIVTAFLAAAAWGIWYFGAPLVWVSAGFLVIWTFFVFIRILRAYVDWRYDLIFVTADKIVIVDQSSVFHMEIRQMHLENFASVGARTQFWNLFPFGMLCFDLKEGIGQRLCLKYIPDAEATASAIAHCIRTFQRGTSSQSAVPPSVQAA